MAYDEGLAQRLREFLEHYPMVDEKKMFGGIGFMLEGNIACGILKDELVVRVGQDLYEKVLQKQDVKVFDFTGRPMKGWVMVRPAGYESDAVLREWVDLGAKFALSLPPK